VKRPTGTFALPIILFKRLIQCPPPPAHAQAHDTQAQAQAHAAHAQTQSALGCAGSWEVFAGGGTMELANFSMLTTMLLEVFSTAVAMLFANSAPGMAGAGPDCAGALMFGVYLGCGLYVL
jgi:hypothetical protein